MRGLTLIISFVAIIYLTTSVQETAAIPPPVTSPELVAAVFNEITRVVLSLKFTDIPDELVKKPTNELWVCLSPKQQELTSTCTFNVHPFLQDATKISKDDVLVIVECILELMNAYDREKNIMNVGNLKKGMIDGSLLSPGQKKEAEKSVDTCLNSTFDLPSDIVKQNKTVSAKAMICSVKSLIINGCPDFKSA